MSTDKRSHRVNTNSTTSKYQPPSPSRFFSIPLVSALYSWHSSRPTQPHPVRSDTEHVVHQPLLPAFHSFESETEADQAPYPPLPNELIHLIFSFCASESLEGCQALCLVSSWSRRIVLPFLMQTIIVLNDSHFLLNDDDVQAMGPGWRSPMSYTRNLWLDDAVVGPDLERVLRKCPNVMKLALSGHKLETLLEGEAHCMLHSSKMEISVHSASTEEQCRLFTDGTREHADHPFLQRIAKLTLGTTPNPSTCPINLFRFSQLKYLSLRFFRLEAKELEALLSSIQQNGSLQRIVVSLMPDGLLPSGSDSGRSLADEISKRAMEDERLSMTIMTATGWPLWKACVEGRTIEVQGEVFEPELMLPI